MNFLRHTDDTGCTNRRLTSRRFSMRESGAGFSLVELMVVIGLVTAISAVILFNQSAFQNSILLGILVYDVAISVREAQTYGISTRGTSASLFTSAYGIHFSSNTNTTQVPSIISYLLFADIAADDGLYVSGADQPVRTLSIQSGYKIEKLCMTISPNPEECSVPGGQVWIADVSFKRPYPDARIKVDPGTGFVVATGLKVVLKSPKGDTRYVEILQTGQLSIQQHL